ncbi:hypothetical protein JCM3774_005874 [Rhodotorula dairenensis]
MSMFSLRTILETTASRGAKVISVALVWLALALGTATSLALSNSTLSSTFSSGCDTLTALVLYELVTTAIPLAGTSFLLAAVPAQQARSFTSIFLAGLVLALVGSLYEHISGIGRVGWWIRAPGLEAAESLTWARRSGGAVFVDWVAGAAAFALAQLAWTYTAVEAPCGGPPNTVNLLHETLEDEEEEASPANAFTEVVGSTSRSKPAYFLLVLALLTLLTPLFPAHRLSLTHPSPDHRSYVYPPLPVGCVSPASPPGRHRATIDDWLKETTVLAGRGVKVLSWSEGAVRLDRGAEHEPTDREAGWNAFGNDEQSLLRRVAKVCDMYKVYVLATYSVPPPTDSGHRKLLNVATLVGPRGSRPTDDDAAPNIVFSTTKQHPVPFVESYSHAGRTLPDLGPVDGALPVARVALPHSTHTPSPRLTPLQQVTLSAAICQDAAYPALISTLAPVGVDGDASHAPQLILNPSATPSSLQGLGQLSLAQARARAVEQGAFVLRCDEPGSGSGSVLIDPTGQVRVWTGSHAAGGGDRGGSWEAAIEPEEAWTTSAHRRAYWTWLGGTSADSLLLGAESRLLLLLGTVVLLVRVVDGGEARRCMLATDWRQAVSRTGEGLQAVRGRARSAWRERRGVLREDGSVEAQARLVEVD